jgi:demethylmenaquinone methyltransferase/2-methoxy-6-polyprenyl-1,4-benzoquinol methylase
MQQLRSPVDVPVHDPHPVLSAYYSSAEGKQRFVGYLFDSSAVDYDRVNRFVAFGTGSWYRREALRRAGLAPGMRVLDVAVGTGLVSKEAVRIVGDRGSVTGIDPSAGMISSAAVGGLALVRGRAETLPFATGSFDFVALGFALRHLADLETVFLEFRRVLKPGGRLLVLEITRPEGRLANVLLRAYLRNIVPFLAGLLGRSRHTPTLCRYHWDTVESCVPPARVMATMAAAGFEGVRNQRQIGIFSEYSATA